MLFVLTLEVSEDIRLCPLVLGPLLALLVLGLLDCSGLKLPDGFSYWAGT